MSVLPILISWYVVCYMNDKTPAYNLISILSKGELLIICSTILGVNIGELSTDSVQLRWKPLKIVLVALSIILSLFTLGAYVAVTVLADKTNGMALDSSIVFLLATIVICVSSIALPKAEG